MKTDNHIDFGKQGEQIATDYLLSCNYQIIERNYVCGKNEIDIIARKSTEIIFIEVKTRATDIFGDPEQAVNRQKQRAIIKVANAYIINHNIDLEARFDVVSIVINENSEPYINHIKYAFAPSLV
jgi:putative endonuclease